MKLFGRSADERATGVALDAVPTILAADMPKSYGKTPAHERDSDPLIDLFYKLGSTGLENNMVDIEDFKKRSVMLLEAAGRGDERRIEDIVFQAVEAFGRYKTTEEYGPYRAD